MRKIVWFLLALIVLSLGSCSDEEKHRASGQWQLEKIDRNGTVSTVDTVFFAFQRGKIFSFTVLERPEEAHVSYGYLETPSDNVFRIAMDTSKSEEGYYRNLREDLLSPYGWAEENNFTQILTVEQLDGKNMILSSPEATFYLKKH